MSPWNRLLEESCSGIAAKRPLVHHITNYVVMNLTANVTLALGASPVMAHDTGEVEEMASFASALVINIGTLSPKWIEAMVLAGRRAKERGVPVVLDPVGAGATTLRTETCRRLMDEVRPDVIRGNRAEVSILAGAVAKIQGVDSMESGVDPVELYKSLARDSGAVVCVTGATDFVTDGSRLLRVANGHPLFGRVTGMGCAATTTVAVFAAVSGGRLLESTALAMAVFGACGEVAAECATGPGSFVPALIDALARVPGDVGSRLRISE